MIVSGIVGFIGVYWFKSKLKYDDSLDAFGVHGLNGIWDAIATSIFANPSVNSAGKGLLHGNPRQVIVQVEAVLATIMYTAIMTAILYFITSILTGGARVDKETEIIGLDESVHGERDFEIYIKILIKNFNLKEVFCHEKISSTIRSNLQRCSCKCWTDHCSKQ